MVERDNRGRFAPKETPTIEERLHKEKHHFRIDDFATELGVGTVVVQRVIDELKEKGYVFDQTPDGKIVKATSILDGTGKIDMRPVFAGDNVLRFGVVADSHLGSKKERLQELNSTYDRFQREGITTVFNAGDVTEGVGVYRGQEYEVHKHGQDEQIDYAIKAYPKRDGITTYTISGNHDLRQTERGGIDPLIPISRQRKDIVYMGQMVSMAQIADNLWAEIIHPAGGGAYALSYKAQRDINNRVPENLPDILMYGHYHHSYYMYYRNIHFLQVPCFKDAGGWERRLGLNPTIGAWIVEAKIGDGEGGARIESFTPQLHTYSTARK